ncbi:MAG: 2-oxo acid dehydrogenase subunit E2 [Flavobacteriales bacterium]|nr:2-oxo acid dehydrogenase subunit E2 [Flavobacteriales bacterium]
MKNINYHPPQKMSAWRKISLGSWKPRGDSSVYCWEEVVMDDFLKFCDDKAFNKYSMLILALSKTLEVESKINATVRRGRIYQRKDISVFFHTVDKNRDRDDLSGIIIQNGHRKKAGAINQEFLEKVNASKKGGDHLAASKQMAETLHPRLVSILMKVYGYIAYQLNQNWKVFKGKQNAFGSVMLTAVGSVGITNALCPIAPYTHVPMVISAGKIIEKPVVYENSVKIKKVMCLGFTFDHRIMEGKDFGHFFAKLNDFIQNPTLLNE